MFTAKSPVVDRFTFKLDPAAGVMVRAVVEMREGVETDVGATILVAVSVSVAKVRSASSTKIPEAPAKVTRPEVSALLVSEPDTTKDVPVAAPKTGVMKVGVLLKTKRPEPVSSETDKAALADVMEVTNAPPVVVETNRSAVSPEKVMVPEEVIPVAAVMAPVELTRNWEVAPTESMAAGLVVPMPRLPEAVRRARSAVPNSPAVITLPVPNAI